MFYTYSRHASRIGAEIALENYFAEGTVCEGERPRIRYERGKGWLVEFFDWSCVE